jgi:hypothetical protein
MKLNAFFLTFSFEDEESEIIQKGNYTSSLSLSDGKSPVFFYIPHSVGIFHA